MLFHNGRWRPIKVENKNGRTITYRPLTGPKEELCLRYKAKWSELVGILSPYDLTDRNVVVELLTSLLDVGSVLAEGPRNINKLHKNDRLAKQAGDSLVAEFCIELEKAGWPKHTIQGLIAQAGYLSRWGIGADEKTRR